MLFDVVATTRDWALILLALEAFVLSLVFLLVLREATRGLRGLVPRAALILSRAERGLARFRVLVERAMMAVTRPLIWVTSTFAGVSACLKRVRCILTRGR